MKLHNGTLCITLALSTPFLISHPLEISNFPSWLFPSSVFHYLWILSNKNFYPDDVNCLAREIQDEVIGSVTSNPRLAKFRLRCSAALKLFSADEKWFCRSGRSDENSFSLSLATVHSFANCETVTHFSCQTLFSAFKRRIISWSCIGFFLRLICRCGQKKKTQQKQTQSFACVEREMEIFRSFPIAASQTEKYRVSGCEWNCKN